MGAPIIDGTTLPDVDRWSDRVVVALGQNPSVYTGPGTNTYLIGTGPARILLDPGQGFAGYLPVLERAMDEAGCEAIQEIVLTHGHPDHLRGVPQMLARFGDLKVSKMPWPKVDAAVDVPMAPIAHDSVVRTEGATLRAVHTPGHAPDHLCFVLEEERTLFSGDNVLGIGTTVIPAEVGEPRRLHGLARAHARGAAGTHLPGARARDRGRHGEDRRIPRTPARARAPDRGRCSSRAPCA